jgi:hypothetical protein
VIGVGEREHEALAGLGGAHLCIGVVARRRQKGRRSSPATGASHRTGWLSAPRAGRAGRGGPTLSPP